MRTWARTVVGCRCGRCGAQLAEGTDVELAEVEGLKRKLIRCEKCALTPKPLVLETPGRSTKAMKPLRLALPAHLLKFRDGKAKAAHD